MRRRSKVAVEPVVAPLKWDGRFPAVFYDPTRLFNSRNLAVEKAKNGSIVCVEYDVGDMAVNARFVELGQLGGRFPVVLAAEDPVPECVRRLKHYAIRNGATPEAIRLLGQVSPFTKDEETTMAAKLKSKGDAAALKAAAKEAPVAKPAADKPRRKGNPEALAAAREGRVQPDRKITVLVKAKDSGLREGSGRYQKLAFVSKFKKTSEVLGQPYSDDGGKIDNGALAGMVKRGHITLT